MLSYGAMLSFAKSVFFGALTGAAPFLLGTTMIAVTSLPSGIDGDGRIFPTVWFAALPLIVTIPIVLSASIVIGLPLTLILRRQGRETEAAYIGTGAMVGFALPIICLLATRGAEGYWMSALGAASGAVTGRTWWASAREQNVSFDT